ncbi:MAG: serine/threonine-protein kinase, partial [Planctomycetota bacterium]
MADNDWSRVKALFNEAVERCPEERSAFLDQACKDDHGLRARVMMLLDADSSINGFLETPALAAVDDLPPGSSFGSYQLQRIVSSGGMGIVYEALQEKPHRQVAIKVMKEGFSSKEAYRRFQYESEILARLDHPNIAKVIEAGTHVREGALPTLQGEGVPYIVMEYIEGARPITTYVQEKGLSSRERIVLFLDVCRAVHHGHQKGVIHRDLKPGNILVDAKGRAKVIDFGVARATGQSTAGTLHRTEMGQLIGTVRYMSPEQCKADPGDLDTRSDVYTLGLVLY